MIKTKIWTNQLKSRSKKWIKILILMKTKNSKSNLQMKALKKSLSHKPLNLIKMLIKIKCVVQEFSFLTLNLPRIFTNSQKRFNSLLFLKQTWIESNIWRNWKESTMMFNSKSIFKTWCKWVAWTLIETFRFWNKSETI